MSVTMSVEKSSNNGNIAGFFDAYFLGIVIVIVGELTFWNEGFKAGFWEYFFATGLISVGYLCLVLCLAEMISILPFSGGSYGFARVTMGPYVGFIIGCCDSIPNIIYVSALVRELSLFITHATGAHHSGQYTPIYWLLCYAICLVILIPLGRWNFTFMTVVGAVTLVIPVIYAAATADEQDFHRYVTLQEDGIFYAEGMGSFMKVLPLSSWMFIGIDLVCLVCDDTRDARRVVPRAIVAGMVTLIVLAFLVLVTCAANAPGIAQLATVALPLNAGFSSAFHISDRLATLLSIPAVFISLYGMTYIYGRQICALSRSQLLPKFFSRTTADNVPYMALVCGSGLGYFILVVLYYADPHFPETLNDLFYVSQMASFAVYIVAILSFVVFRYKYSTLERQFVNLLGTPSAVVGCLVFALAFVGLAFYQQDNHAAISIFAVFIAVISLYYFLYARHKQCFSPEEQSILFAVYVIKSNSRKRTVWNWMGRKINNVATQLEPSLRVKITSKSSSSRGNSRAQSSKKGTPTAAMTGVGPSSKASEAVGEVQLFSHKEEASFEHPLGEASESPSDYPLDLAVVEKPAYQLRAVSIDECSSYSSAKVVPSDCD